jgi:hypothetical protein
VNPVNPVDPAELVRAAGVLVCAPVAGRPGGRLVGAGERFCIVADARSRAIADAMAEAAREGRGLPEIYRLDLLANESTGKAGGPHKVLPAALGRALSSSPSGAFVARALVQERSMRLQLRDIIHASGKRHAYMPDITEAAFAGGLRSPQDAVIAVGRFMAKRLRGARSLQCDSPGGTRLSITLNRAAGWVARLGEIEPGRTTPFPAGTLFAMPQDVQGTFVADASLGEFLGAHEGVLSNKAVRFTIEAGRVTRVDAGPNAELQGQVDALLRVSPNSDRVGLVCIGVNEGVRAPTGDSAADTLIAGLHLFIGDPAGRSTGAAWTARTSLAACQAMSRVLVDGRVVIEGGNVLG